MENHKNKIGWALVDRKTGKQVYYYGMYFILPTKKQAKIELDYYNGKPLNHDYTVKKIKIIY